MEIKSIFDEFRQYKEKKQVGKIVHLDSTVIRVTIALSWAPFLVFVSLFRYRLTKIYVILISGVDRGTPNVIVSISFLEDFFSLAHLIVLVLIFLNMFCILSPASTSIYLFLIQIVNETSDLKIERQL